MRKILFYPTTGTLYPLSFVDTSDERRNTIVTAPTGAGKTDFLLRRCKGRVFYTLPFQASINAMYDRIKNDLKNTDAHVYLLHAAAIPEVRAVADSMSPLFTQSRTATIWDELR